MSVSDVEKPYQLGMTLLFTGSIINWMARDYYHRSSMQYVAQLCVIFGVLCMCVTVYRWYREDYPIVDPSSTRVIESSDSSVVTINTTSFDSMPQKPPDYLIVEDPPPNYDDAIKLQIENFNNHNLNPDRKTIVPVHGHPTVKCKTPPPPYLPKID